MPVVAVVFLHADETQLGYLNAAGTAAFLLVGLPAGAWVDRWFKRRVMLWADAARLIAAFTVPVLWFTHHLAIWQLYVVAAVVGLATVFFDIAYQSFVPVLVPAEQIGPANARLESTAQIATMGGPALGGLAMKLISAPMLLLADAVGYLASVLCLLATRDDEASYRAASEPRPRQHLLADIREGLAFVLGHPVLRRIVTATGLSNLFAGMGGVLWPLLILHHLHLSPFMFGLVMSAASAGGAVGAMITPALQRRMDTGTLILGSLLASACFGFATPIATLFSNRYVALGWLLAGQFLTFTGVLAYNITQVSLRQGLCPKHLLGRMNASIRFIVWGIIPLSSLLGGFLGAHLHLVPTLWLAAIGGLTAALPLVGLDRLLPPHRTPREGSLTSR